MQAAATARNLNLGMGLALGLLGLSVPASAQDPAPECQVDGDCGPGYVCTVQQGGACTDIACLPGQICPEPQCELTEYHLCQPAPCSQASDCPADMVCHAHVTSDCATSGAAAPTEPCPEGKCEAPIARPSPECTQQTESLCTPRFLLPCTTASDCGTGFLCVEEISGWCSGGAPAPSVDGGAADPIAPECGETRTGKYACQLIEKSCQIDADCAVGFVCADDPTASSCGGSDSAGSSDSPVADFAPPDIGGVAVDAGTKQPCAPSPAEKLCLPRNYSYGRDIASDGLASSGSDAKGEVAPPTASSDEESAKSGGDGCSLRAGGHPGSGWMFMLASLGTALVYRRRSATRN